MLGARGWEVEFVGGPFDGRTEVHGSADDVPRLAILAICVQQRRCGEPSVTAMPNVAIYELDSAAAHYQHVRCLSGVSP